MDGSSWLFRLPSGAQWQFHAAVLVMAAGWLIALILPMTPGVDVHRYIWEGRIQTQSFNPYRYAPQAAALTSMRDENWSLVEFKASSAIYPPLAELGFRALAMISQSALFFKLAFIGADLLVCLLLSNRFGFARSLVHAWNPLILYSFAVGAHFDSWFIFCLVAGWLLWEKGRPNQAAAMLGAATALKWVSLPVFVWLIWRIARRDGAQKALVAGCVGVLPFVIGWVAVTRGDFVAPLWPKEFVLYARSFELVPALLSSLWPSAYLQNTTCLLQIAGAALLLLRTRSLILFGERWLVALLALSPMVHAWYFTWLIPFAVATRNAGAIAVSMSAFAYFGIFSLPGAPQNGWPLLFLQNGIIWLPLMCGFAGSEYQRAGQSIGQRSLKIREYKRDVRLLPL